jgi:hypothetical protein
MLLALQVGTAVTRMLTGRRAVYMTRDTPAPRTELTRGRPELVQHYRL